MKAVVRKRFGEPNVLEVRDVPMPKVLPDCVLIRIRAFGLNHAELYMRRGEWGDVAPISGIECVGTVETDATGRLRRGQMVVALMGGMGRSINGSYAQYTVVPATNVMPIDTTLAWDALAALPESYAVAWTCLDRNLDIQPGQRLVVRGGTSALGQAAIDIAAQRGAEVIATTRQPDRAPFLRALGAAHVIIAGNELIHAVGWPDAPIDAVLDLLGNSTMLDSLRTVRRGGRVCLAGFLGGTSPLVEFNPLSQMPSGVHLSFFGSFNFGTHAFPLSDVPMQAIADRVAGGAYRGRPARIFSLDEVAIAHAVMERGEMGGKGVVLL